MAETWVDLDADEGFGVENLPYGVFSAGPGTPNRLGVRIGSRVLDLHPFTERGQLRQELGAPNLNPFLAAGHHAWSEARATITELLTDQAHEPGVSSHLIALDTVSMRLPFDVADYVDFYSSEQHATNLGKMFRPDSEPLLPNWKHLPVGYHGRAGTVVVSDTPIARPFGQRRGQNGPTYGPSERLDIELELGFVIGGSTILGAPVPIHKASEHIFGMMLVNDWSARDIQAWEYQPLGPFLGKSFATSIGAWVVPMAALDAARVDPPTQDPAPLDYLRTDEPWGFDIDLEVQLSTVEMRGGDTEPAVVSRTNFKDMYWTPAQQLAHMTVNGATVRPR